MMVLGLLEENFNAEKLNKSIDISNLKAGIYVFNIQTSTGIWSQKFTKV